MRNKLRAAGVMPVLEGFAMAVELQLHWALLKKAEDEDKAWANCNSYKDYVATWRKFGFMTREACDIGTGRVWHHQSVETIYMEHGWAPAGEYHKRVMDLCSWGFLDGCEIDTFEFHRGKEAGTMHCDTDQDVLRKLNAREESKAGQSG